MIKTSAVKHTEFTRRYEGAAPKFPLILDSVTGLTAVHVTSERMRTIVRKAQRDFQFASIFEQRKTNQLLVAGFINLAQALEGMGNQIACSIEDLGGQISEMSSAVESSIDRVNSTMVSELGDMQAAMREDAEERIKRHERALEMLDNIQRRRRPRRPG